MKARTVINGFGLLFIPWLFACGAVLGQAGPNLVPEGSFAGGEEAAKAAGWQLGSQVSIAGKDDPDGPHLRVDCEDPVRVSRA